MARIVSSLFIALDGVVEVDPEWHFRYFDSEMGVAVGEDYDGADVLLLGRVTYDSFAGAWPDREQAGGPDAGFAKQLGDARKVVATRGSQDLGWRNAERTDDLITAASVLRDDTSIEKVLVCGSISVVRQLLAAGLLDEIRLMVHPIAARRGERLFDDGDAMYPFDLVRSQAFPTGVVRLIYAAGQLPADKDYGDVTDDVPPGDS